MTRRRFEMTATKMIDLTAKRIAKYLAESHDPDEKFKLFVQALMSSNTGNLTSVELDTAAKKWIRSHSTTV